MISQKAANMSSKEHVQHSRKTWIEGETRFKNIINSIDSSEEDNINHVDVFTDYGSVDVKGYRKAHRVGLVLVEFLNVQGRQGWCSKNSKVQNIAFEFEEGFYIVKKADLRDLCVHLCGEFGEVPRENRADPEKNIYKYLGRVARKDVFCYIRKEDLFKINYLFVCEKTNWKTKSKT